MNTIFSRAKGEKPAEKSLTKPPVQEGEIIEVPQNSPFTPHMYNFLQKFWRKSTVSQTKSVEGTIKVSEVFGVIALVYEKIRGAVEYKREHLLHRNAIERILRRLLWERQGRNVETTAHLLLRELIWAHYLPNDHIPKSKIPEVAGVIQKYLDLANLMGGYSALQPKQRDWMLGIASYDIERTVDPDSEREFYVELMYEWFKAHFIWKNTNLSQHKQDIQIYLAVHRSLPKSDDPIMRYYLLVKEVPQWQNPRKEDILHLAQNFSKTKDKIENHLSHPIHLSLYRFVKKHAPPFEILQEAINTSKSTLQKIMTDSEQLELKIREVCQLKYNLIRRKVNQGIVRSVIYIFVTKVLLALVIEIPYEVFILHEIATIPIAINVVVPPSLMFLIGLTIRTPDEKNTKRIIDRINNIVFAAHQSTQVPFTLVQARKRSLLTTVFSLIYLILFFITFGGISIILYQLNFNIVGAGVFFVFLSLVLLFGFRVRSTATELKVTGDKEGFIGYVFNNLSLPFLNFGMLLSRGIARLNFIILIMDFLIEAPLKTIIEVIEEWTTFVREKREEVVEIPPE